MYLTLYEINVHGFDHTNEDSVCHLIYMTDNYEIVYIKGRNFRKSPIVSDIFNVVCTKILYKDFYTNEESYIDLNLNRGNLTVFFDDINDFKNKYFSAINDLYQDAFINTCYKHRQINKLKDVIKDVNEADNVFFDHERDCLKTISDIKEGDIFYTIKYDEDLACISTIKILKVEKYFWDRVRCQVSIDDDACVTQSFFEGYRMSKNLENINKSINRHNILRYHQHVKHIDESKNILKNHIKNYQIIKSLK